MTIFIPKKVERLAKVILQALPLGSRVDFPSRQPSFSIKLLGFGGFFEKYPWPPEAYGGHDL